MKDWILRNRSWTAIGFIVLALAIWVATGDEDTETEQAEQPSGVVKVGLTHSRAESIERVVTAQGHVEPEQTVRVRAKTGGEVVETPVEEGTLVEEGQRIARLDLDDRGARLKEAKANLRRARSDYDAARKLTDQGFQAKLKAERAEADLESARARVASIEQAIEHTRITAPIDGVLNRQLARHGDVVGKGDPVAEIVENDPLRAVVRIPQHRESELAEGQSARVTFIDGAERDGELTYLASTADPQTRTFTARIRVDNPDRDLPAGTSVTVEIPVEEVQAHAISPALISRNAEGALGVKIAEQNDGERRARFVPINPVRADARRVWVTGLPEQVRLISLGQGFVRDGDTIEVAQADGDEAP